jgi:hypothetical protein
MRSCTLSARRIGGAHERKLDVGFVAFALSEMVSVGFATGKSNSEYSRGKQVAVVARSLSSWRRWRETGAVADAMRLRLGL